MKFTQQLLLIFFYVMLGELISHILPINVPGNIIGMILLVLSLSLNLIKLSLIEDVANMLLSHLAIFFIPAGVSILSVAGIIQPIWTYLIIISVSSTILVMIVTALVVNLLRKKVYQ